MTANYIKMLCNFGKFNIISWTSLLFLLFQIVSIIQLSRVLQYYVTFTSYCTHMQFSMRQVAQMQRICNK